MLHSIERYMKQAIVDRHPSVASAALVSSMVSVFCLHQPDVDKLLLFHFFSNY